MPECFRAQRSVESEVQTVYGLGKEGSEVMLPAHFFTRRSTSVGG